MKATELRIGNYIHFTNILKTEKEVVQVSGRYLANFTREDFEISTYYQPIELTEKWLFKFNFKYQDKDINRKDGKLERRYISPYFGMGKEFYLELCLPDDREFKCTWLHWDIGGGSKFIHLPNPRYPNYVHELQNLYFSLSGEELTLKQE